MLRRAVDVYHDEGIRGMWFGCLARIGYRRLELVELDLRPPPPLADVPFPLEFGFLEQSEAADYAALGAGVDAEETRRRLERGERCFVARAGGRIVSGRWLASGQVFVSYLDRRLALEPDEVYVYETYTDPAQRGHAVSAAAGTRLAHLLAEEDARRIVAAALPENTPGRRAYEKAGYHPVGTIGYVKLGPWRRDFLRSERRAGAGR